MAVWGTERAALEKKGHKVAVEAFEMTLLAGVLKAWRWSQAPELLVGSLDESEKKQAEGWEAAFLVAKTQFFEKTSCEIESTIAEINHELVGRSS